MIEPVEIEETGIVQYSTPSQGLQTLVVSREPEEVLEEAKKAARALTKVINSKPKQVKFNGQTYLEFEDWLTVAKFYGATAKVRETKYIELGTVVGFEASADVIIAHTGQIISSAEAMCLNDEDNWSTRATYEWHNGKKVKVGEKPVPLFQLKSMAQTRACAKALRNVFAWVVVLAGYKPTPAEEMTGLIESEQSSNKQPELKQSATEIKRTGTANPTEGETIDHVETKEGSKNGKDWVRYTIVFDSGLKVSTFEHEYGELALSLAGTGTIVAVDYAPSKFGNDLMGLVETGSKSPQTINADFEGPEAQDDLPF